MKMIIITNIIEAVGFVAFLSCRESRYLLFLTENYVALDILQHYLRDLNAAQLMAEGTPELLEPHILFGSCFPKDNQYIQVSIKNNVVLSRVS